MPRGKVVKENEGLTYGYSNEEWTSFHKSKRSRIRHPEMQRKCMKNWAAKQTPAYHRERMRKSQLKLKYNMTIEDYTQMLIAQGGCCAICGTDKPTGKWNVFAVDHDHQSNLVRGILCNECNRGMGLLGDNAERLRKAANYLETHLEKQRKKL